MRPARLLVELGLDTVGSAEASDSLVLWELMLSAWPASCCMNLNFSFRCFLCSASGFGAETAPGFISDPTGQEVERIRRSLQIKASPVAWSGGPCGTLQSQQPSRWALLLATPPALRTFPQTVAESVNIKGWEYETRHDRSPQNIRHLSTN